jgi:hypothetical protein
MMKKWIIRTNTGYGDCYELAELNAADDPLNYAYEVWQDEVEGYADYEAIEYTKELAEELGIEEEEDSK